MTATERFAERSAPGRATARRDCRQRAERGQAAIARPVKSGPWIRLSPRGDLVVAGDVRDRITPAKRAGESTEHRILGVRVREQIGAFELESNRKIVASLAALPRRGASVPGAQCAGDELQQRPVAPDQEVRGDADCRKRAEIRMRVRIEPIGEQLDDGVPAELARRQRDVVNDQQRDALALRPRVAVRRSDLRRRGDDPCSIDIQAARGSGGLRARMGSYRA